MKILKKIIRLLGMVLLIALAAFGIGLAGGIPLKITHKRETQENNVEWVMSGEELETDQTITLHKSDISTN